VRFCIALHFLAGDIALDRPKYEEAALLDMGGVEPLAGVVEPGVVPGDVLAEPAELGDVLPELSATAVDGVQVAPVVGGITAVYTSLLDCLRAVYLLIGIGIGVAILEASRWVQIVFRIINLFVLFKLRPSSPCSNVFQQIG